jgi:hypothetical protein
MARRKDKERTMYNHENDVLIIGDMLTQMDSIVGNEIHQILQRMLLANDIFLYLCENPHLIRINLLFRNAVMSKMAELYEATEEWKTEVDPEGGENFLNTVALLQGTLERLQEQL